MKTIFIKDFEGRDDLLVEAIDQCIQAEIFEICIDFDDGKNNCVIRPIIADTMRDFYRIGIDFQLQAIHEKLCMTYKLVI